MSAWVNGTQVVEHEGAYTPFEADVTDVVEPGAENRVSVVVNNVLTWQSIPPGYVEETPEGRRQFYFHDFFNYAGLHRTVWLYTTPTSYVSDVTVVTGLSGSTGTVNYRVETVGAAYVVRLGGELDLYNAEKVRSALVEACADSPERVVVDLSEVEFMDSTALGVLIEARTKLENHCGFLLAAPALETRRALQISGLDRHFSVHDTVPEALVAKV